jgi:HAD superfamily 5'-nucleotidase-like hydrolase
MSNPTKAPPSGPPPAPTAVPATEARAVATRQVFANRTLNLRAVKAIGYDMDYTLIHYHVKAWERRAFDYLQQKLVDHGWPVGDLEFLPDFAVRGLVIDTKLGNIVKADGFGYVKRAFHGTSRLEFDQQREQYSRELVDLADRRWVLLNTFFSLSEAVMYAQLVDRIESRAFPPVVGFAELWQRIRHALDSAHAEGRLKAEIVERPDDYVELDAEMPLTLLDQREAGKRLLLVTNSEWTFTRAMMAYAFDRFLPAGTSWRDLFELVIVGARKPEFFSARGPLFRVVDDRGRLEPLPAGPTGPGVYHGGHAELVEDYLGAAGAEILFVGDHLYTDVRISKDLRRWRTGLVVREIEAELEAAARAHDEQTRLDALMARKGALEAEQAQLRLVLQRLERGYGPTIPQTPRQVEGRIARLRTRIERLDEEIAPLAVMLGSQTSALWGPLMATGSAQSYLARQLEDSADFYTSRVSNLLTVTPFAYMRAPRGRMPHDAI